MRKKIILSSLLAACILSVSAPGIAAESISKQEAATIAKSRFQGRVIAVDESRQDSTTVYRVKVLDKKGGMHTVIIDYQSGSIISAH